ncbi:hypothetical protein ONS96_002377 [Cadophora gregata f. sp. sojae]|nr:hypothetical protein ONS96_002377 [Cadophora gregata f. sp. sojae]
MRFALNANIADHADLVVDGVLRNSLSTSIAKNFKGAFEKALYQGMKSSSKRGAVKYSKMQVKELLSFPGLVSTNSSALSAVGSLELRLYRVSHDTSVDTKPSEKDSLGGDVDRPPAYEKCAEWYDCISNLEFDGPRPPFHIDFFDHKEAGRPIKERVLKELPTGCKLWAIFVFYLRSSADLRALGFDCPTSLSAQLLLPTSSTTSIELKASNAEGCKQKPEDTLIGNALVESISGHSPGNKSDCSEIEKIEAHPLTAPASAPRTTSNSLLNIMASSDREEGLSVSENLEDRSAGQSVTHITKRSILTRTTPQNSHYYSSQGLGFVINGARLKRVPVIERPEPGMSANTSSNDVQLKQDPADECDTPRKSRERGLIFLPGVTGVNTSPAHKAFLERPATEDAESREVTPTPAHEVTQGDDGNNFTYGQQNSPHLSASRRGFSQPPKVLASIEGGQLSLSVSQDESLGSAWKPGTAPMTSLMQQIQTVQRGSASLNDTWALPNIKLSNSFVKDSLVSVDGQDNLTKFDFLLPDTFTPSSPLGTSQQNKFTFHQPGNPAIDSQSEPLLSRASVRRAPSEASSEADTEVAEPEDTERIVKASRRSTQTTNTSRFPSHPLPLNDISFNSNVTEEEQGNHTHPSPVLGSRRYSNSRSGVGSPLSRSSTADTKSYSTPSSPMQQIRENLSAEPLTPYRNSLPNFEPETVKNLTSKPGTKQPMSQTQTPLKRKSDAMARNVTPDPVSPRKTSIAPAERKHRFEDDKAAAKARIAAAERKREGLQKKLEAARELKREMDKVHELHQKAADVEQENAEMEAEIAAIYGTKNTAHE